MKLLGFPARILLVSFPWTAEMHGISVGDVYGCRRNCCRTLYPVHITIQPAFLFFLRSIEPTD